MTLTLRSGRPASRFAFGTMQFGARADEAASRAMFEAARAASSARSAEQLASSLAALEFEMTPELRARLSTLTPTPAPATDRLEEL